jgi:hypothetical protein
MGPRTPPGSGIIPQCRLGYDCNGVGETYAAGDKVILNVSSTPFPAALPGSVHPNT